VALNPLERSAFFDALDEVWHAHGDPSLEIVGTRGGLNKGTLSKVRNRSVWPRRPTVFSILRGLDATADEVTAVMRCYGSFDTVVPRVETVDLVSELRHLSAQVARLCDILERNQAGMVQTPDQ
jgi:hypothetical protein